MKRLHALLGQVEFQVLLFFLSIVLFGWPLISTSDAARLKFIFIYLFLSWSVVILLLFFVSRSQSIRSQPEETDSSR
jgi:hypothetical protein